MVTIAGAGGPRELPLAELFRGFQETARERGELITAVTVPLPPPGAGRAYVKWSSLSADDWPCVGAAALVALAANDRSSSRDGDHYVTGAPVRNEGIRPCLDAVAAELAEPPERPGDGRRAVGVGVLPISDTRLHGPRLVRAGASVRVP